MPFEQKLQALGLSLPPTPTPVASYVPAVQTGNLVFSSGQIPSRQGTLAVRGQVGIDVGEDEARDAARIAALNALAAIKSVVGDLDRISRIVRVTGYVSSAPGFTDQPAVVNGASDLLLELFGHAGQHARSAVGVSALPLDAPVEIEIVAEVE